MDAIATFLIIFVSSFVFVLYFVRREDGDGVIYRGNDHDDGYKIKEYMEHWGIL